MSWHKQKDRERKEWVVYAAAGVVLLIVAGGVAIGVVVAKKNSGNSSSTNTGVHTDSTNGSTAGAAVADPPVVDGVLDSQPSNAGELIFSPEELSPEAIEPPSDDAAGSQPSSSGTDPSQPAEQERPQQQAGDLDPAPASENAEAEPPVVTASPGAVPTGTKGSAPPAPGFVQAEVPTAYKGTCSFHDGREHYCQDDMDYGTTDGLVVEDFQLLQDAEMMEECGFAPLTKIVNDLVPWAYKRQCGISAFTVARGCVGKTPAAAGHWRTRVMLWPDNWDECEPLCIKLRGQGDSVTAYGRTGSCNKPRETS